MTNRFPIEAEKVAATLASLLEAQGQRDLADIVRAARASVEETGYDNWNGGTYFHTLHLELPVAAYAKVEPTLRDIEQSIAAKLETALRITGSDLLREVMITPAFDDASAGAVAAVPGDDIARLWGVGGCRLFLSHISAHKAAVADLKRELRVYGVAAFVAHEDIEPSLEWQAEIELALRSMHAMAALLTPGFHASSWTDQEIGVAFGRAVLVIPVRLPENPYGFIAKNQGLRGDLSQPATLASAMVDILLKRDRTAEPTREGLVVGVETAVSFAQAKMVTAKIETVHGLTTEQLERLEVAIGSNGQVGGSHGIPARLRALVARSGGDVNVSAVPR
jgi:hypothetical protein